jgi:hypothetical protein
VHTGRPPIILAARRRRRFFIGGSEPAPAGRLAYLDRAVHRVHEAAMHRAGHRASETSLWIAVLEGKWDVVQNKVRPRDAPPVSRRSSKIKMSVRRSRDSSAHATSNLAVSRRF